MAGIYIHIPFCKSKCTYCDFASFPKEIGKAELYFACLYKELKARQDLMKDKTINTIYFGGGTPSFVEPKYIYGALKQIYTLYNVSKNAEITLEVNPGTIDENKLKVYKNAGINRFSIGLQSQNDQTLKLVNRIHDKEDYIKAINLLKGYNISTDIMIGLPNESFEDVKKSIDLAISFEDVKHISLYALKAEEGTPMFTKYLNGELLSDDEVAEIYEKCLSYLEEKGFFRYEVSNFAKKGYHSLHNLNYWQRGEYLGVGIGASSFVDETRFTNTESIDEYCKVILSGYFPEVYREKIEDEDKKGEYIMLALRTTSGLSLSDYKNKFNKDFLVDYKKQISKNSKYLNITSTSVAIKPEFLYVQNSILIDFIG